MTTALQHFPICDENETTTVPTAKLLIKVERTRTGSENQENRSIKEAHPDSEINIGRKGHLKGAKNGKKVSNIENKHICIPNGTAYGEELDSVGPLGFSLLFFFAKGHLETKISRVQNEFPDLLDANTSGDLQIEATFASLVDALEARKKLTACAMFSSTQVEISVEPCNVANGSSAVFGNLPNQSFNSLLTDASPYAHCSKLDTESDAVFSASTGLSPSQDSSRIVGANYALLSRKRNLSIGSLHEYSYSRSPMLAYSNLPPSGTTMGYSRSFSLAETTNTFLKSPTSDGTSQLPIRRLSLSEVNLGGPRSLSLNESSALATSEDFSLEFLEDEPSIQKSAEHEFFQFPMFASVARPHSMGQRSMSLAGIPSELNYSGQPNSLSARKPFGGACTLPGYNPQVSTIGENAPCNTLYVGNLPVNACEEELRLIFSKCIGYKRLSFKNKLNGPMCFVEFEDIHCATVAMNELYGAMLSNSCKNGIRLSYSKNPLGVKPQPAVGNAQLAPKGPAMTLQPFDLIPTPVIQNAFSPVAC